MRYITTTVVIVVNKRNGSHFRTSEGSSSTNVIVAECFSDWRSMNNLTCLRYRKKRVAHRTVYSRRWLRLEWKISRRHKLTRRETGASHSCFMFVLPFSDDNTAFVLNVHFRIHYHQIIRTVQGKLFVVYLAPYLSSCGKNKKSFNKATKPSSIQTLGSFVKTGRQHEEEVQ